MKKNILILMALIFANTSFSQIKAFDKATIKTPTIPTETCKEWLQVALSHEPGILTIKINIKQKTTTVSWLTDRNNLFNIKAAISSFGYDADEMEADENAYKKLSKECKMVKAVPINKP